MAIQQFQFDDSIAVIIPTTCERSRAELLERAVRSVLSQSGVKVELLVVANGGRVDSHLFEQLRADTRLRAFQLETGNVSAARFHGVTHVKSRLFCFLDDDDEFLPGAMLRRIQIFAANPHADVVVTNGYDFKEADLPLITQVSAEQINRDPARAFFVQNWFASLGPTFRRDTIEKSVFDINHRYFELTYLFFSLISKGKKIVYDDSFTYRRYADNPLSASKSNAYAAFYPEFLLQLRKLRLGGDIHKIIRYKYRLALNTLSQNDLARGRLLGAWKAHITCIARGGWRFLPYTRQLLRASFSARYRKGGEDRAKSSNDHF